MIIRTFETLDWRVKENTRISFQLHFNRYITTALLNKCYLVSIRNAINLFSKTNLTRLQSVHTLLTLGLTGSIHCIKAVRRIYCKLKPANFYQEKHPGKQALPPGRVLKRQRSGVAPERANSPLTHTPKEIPITFFYL